MTAPECISLTMEPDSDYYSCPVVVLDFVTKMWAMNTLTFGYPVPVLGEFFRLTYTHNPGAAFGINIGGSGASRRCQASSASSSASRSPSAASPSVQTCAAQPRFVAAL